MSKPFVLGQSYKTKAGAVVTITIVDNERGHETVCGSDRFLGEGKDYFGGWRYNREQDRGRVTGTDFAMTDPRNLIPEE